MARVLVVDDALMMRKTIGAMLAKAGHVIVDEAANGEQAVLAYKNHRPDLVTMDITMPGVDGIEALAQIISFDPDARVIMVSALGQRHKVFDALQYGAKSYVLKPFKEDKLLSVINEVLGTGSCRTALSGHDTGERGGMATNTVPLAAANSDSLPNSGKPFSVENRDQDFYINILREFVCSDFGDLMQAVQEIASAQPRYVTFNFTSSNAMNGSAAPNFTKVMASITAVGGMVRIICYTRDYTMFFRNDPSVKGAEFELVKKQGAL